MPIYGRTDIEVIRDIRARWLRGEIAKAIAIDLAVGLHVVERWTRDLPRQDKKEEKRRKEALRRYRKGQGHQEIAQAMGISLRRVCRFLEPTPAFLLEDAEASPAL